MDDFFLKMKQVTLLRCEDVCSITYALSMIPSLLTLEEAIIAGSTNHSEFGSVWPLQQDTCLFHSLRNTFFVQLWPSLT